MMSNRIPEQLELDFSKPFSMPIPATNDPWEHRSTNMRCATCMWYVPKKVGETSPPIGRCRKHAPTMGGYPVVFVHDWCGDHKLDERFA